jgi:hypothetical protein
MNYSWQARRQSLLLGSRSLGLLDLEHENDMKMDCLEAVDPKVTRTWQMVINALRSLSLGESQGGYLYGRLGGPVTMSERPSLTAPFTLSVQLPGYYSHFTHLTALHETNWKVTHVLYC